MSLTSIICGIALLTIGEVGPQNMPDTIEPVESPFVMPLFERPVFSSNQLAKELGTNFTRAQRYVSWLKQAGIIREITGMSRNRIYAAEEIIRAIDSPLKLE